MNFKSKGRRNNGITLIALVITIIVLLILAGVTIMMLMGSENAPQKASEAVEKYAIAGAKDEVAMEAQSAILDYYNKKYVEGNGTDGASIQSEVAKAAKKAVDSAKSKNKQLLSDSGVTDNTITLKTKSYTVTGTIDENGSITWGDIVASTGKTGSTAEKLSETDTTETWSVESFGNLNDDLGLPKEKNIIAKKGTEEDEQQVVIPAGFIQAVDSGETLEDGIVIEDAGEDSTKKENQFVWVPVEQKLEFKGQEEESGTIQLGRYDFGYYDVHKLEGPNEGDYAIRDYTETSRNSEARDIEEFKTQTNLAKGYYIGRYEMGKENGSTAVCKAGVSVITDVTRDQAKEASQNLYNDVKKDEKIMYTSDLINSYAWDIAIVYIMKTTGDNEYAYQGDDSKVLSNTGENGDEKCKINDMASNVQEWTTEYSNDEYEYDDEYWYYPCVYRGGVYDIDSSSYAYTGGRGDTEDGYSDPDTGFRPILYIVGLNA